MFTKARKMKPIEDMKFGCDMAITTMNDYSVLAIRIDGHMIFRSHKEDSLKNTPLILPSKGVSECYAMQC